MAKNGCSVCIRLNFDQLLTAGSEIEISYVTVFMQRFSKIFLYTRIPQLIYLSPKSMILYYD